MQEQITKTNSEITNRMLQILDQQKQLMLLLGRTNNKAYFNRYHALSEEFRELRKALQDLDISQ